MRKNLKIFRATKLLSQEQMAATIGVTRSTYAAIENGDREGRKTFWRLLQCAFNIPDAEMYGLMKNEEE